MLIKRLAQFVGTTVLIIIFASGVCWSQTAAKKTRVLVQLTQAPKTQLSARVDFVMKTNPTESVQLALDMIVYKWMVRQSDMPLDVTNITVIIPALTRELDDPTVSWAQQMFSTIQSGNKFASPPPKNDESFTLLADLRSDYLTAMDYKESYPTQAVDSLVALVEICQKLRLDLSEAVVLKELGDHYLYGMARYRDAEECYKNASLIFASYSCTRSGAIIYDDCGWLNFEMGRYSAAIDNYTLAAQQWMLLASLDPSGYRYRDLAGREYMRAGDASRAAGDTARALQMMTAYGLDQLRTWAHATQSYSELVKNLIEVAELCKDRGNISRALDLIQEAKRASLLSNDSLLIAKTYAMLSEIYTAAHQDANSAEAEHKRELVLATAAAASDTAILKLEKYPLADEKTRQALRAKAENGASAYMELGKFDKSAAAWKRIADIYSTSSMTDQRIAALRSLAEVQNAQGKSEDSLEIWREAAMIAMKANKKTLAADIVQYDMVPAFIEMGDLQRFMELVPIIENSGNLRGFASVLEARGSLFAKYGQYDEAIRDLQDARIRYLSQVGDSWAACDISLKLAAAQRLAGHKEDARSTLETSLDIIESKSADDKLDPALNSTHSDIIMNLYCDLAADYVLEDRSADAQNLLQKARRYSWLPERISQMRKDPNPKIAQFAQSLDLVAGAGQSTDSGISGNDRLLADNWADCWRTCLLLRKQNPSVYNSLPINPLDLCRARDSLPKLGAVVEYMFTDTGVYVFICKYQKSVCRQIRISRQDLDKQISDLRAALKNCEDSQSAGIPIPPINDWQGQAFAEIKKPLEGLYNILIAPIKQDIETAQTLHFALPDELLGLPMHALIEPGDPDSTDVPKFLIREYGISYLSQGMLENLIDEDSRINSSSDRLALFVDPENNLPGAQDEAKAIKALYLNSQRYVGENATRENFIKEAGSASVLHIAAHHKIDPNPAKFELTLAAHGQSDGTVTIDDLLSVANPHLALVVLSACDSISSSDPISSGPSCAAEVFSMVGAKSILGGLWEVSDKSASKVMGDFYRDLTDDKPRIESLRSAQLAAIDDKQYAHPFYWACFALYGCPW